MARTRNPANANPANEPALEILRLLSRILDFLFDKIRMLPPPLRAVAYFVFLVFFCATTWRMVNGHYLVRGVVMKGSQYMQGCEVRMGDFFYSSNSKGMYYAILTPLQYYRYMLAGEVNLPVACREADPRMPDKVAELREVGIFKLTLSYWDDEFSDIRLGTNTTAPQTGSKAAPFSLGLIASAYAQTPPTPTPPVIVRPAPPTTATRYPSVGDRLVLERITLGAQAKNMREVEFEIEIGSGERPLLLQGAEVGDLPMRPIVTFGEKFYFDVPQASRGTGVEIEMEAPGLFGREEEFKFDIPLQYDRPVPVRGNKGSILILRLVPRTPPE